MLEKHLKRIKQSESGNAEEDEWIEVSELGKKLPQQILEDVPDRSIIVERQNRDHIENYEKAAPKLKDQFKNTAQYSELVKKHVTDKKNSFQKFKKNTQKFDQEVASLLPKHKLAFDLDKLNYKENKVENLKVQLEDLTQERDEIKQTIIHFTNQLKQSETELNFKVEQMDDIKLELKRLEKKEILQNKIKTEEEALEIIKKEISYVGNVEQTKKVFSTINTIVDLLKSKNKSTQNELNDVKKEFKILKENYEKLMSQIK
jgi:chromosome segregation ATPase